MRADQSPLFSRSASDPRAALEPAVGVERVEPAAVEPRPRAGRRGAAVYTLAPHARVELEYKVGRASRWYCGRILRESRSEGRAKFIIQFDNGDKEVRTLAAGSSTWRYCSHKAHGCDHAWCDPGFRDDADDLFDDNLSSSQ